MYLLPRNHRLGVLGGVNLLTRRATSGTIARMARKLTEQDRLKRALQRKVDAKLAAIKAQPARKQAA
jgi:hypothetical protein